MVRVFLIKLALRNLTRHKRRTLITAGVIALAIFFYIFLDSLMIGMADEAFNSIINFDAGHLQVVDSRYWEEREELPLKNLIEQDSKLRERVRELSGFRALAPRLDFGARLNNGVDELPVTARGIIPDRETDVFKIKEYFVEGEMFAPGEYRAVLGKNLADLMELQQGDYITLLVRTEEETFNTIEAEISGLLHTPNPNINENTVYVPLEVAQRVLGVEGRISRLIVRLNDRSLAPEGVTALAEDLREQNSHLRAYTWKDDARSVVSMTEAQKMENQVILGIILLIAVVGIVNTVVLAGLERMEEIGMMKALGLKEKEIITIFVLESTGIGIIGGLLGCLAGVISVAIFNEYGINFYALAGGEGLSSFGIPVLGRIYGGWNPGAMLFVFCFGVAVTTVVSILPSWWAARKDPVEAIYHR